MRKRTPSLAAADLINGFVNRRSTVQSRPPAPRTQAQSERSEERPSKGSTDRARARWIARAVCDDGVDLDAAIAADRCLHAVAMWDSVVRERFLARLADQLTLGVPADFVPGVMARVEGAA